MNSQQVIELLKSHQNERGLLNWHKLERTGGLNSFGIGLTQLRKMAKQIGRNHELALELWRSNYYDAKIIALLIDEPKKITRVQAEQQVDELNAGMLAHVFSSCDATLPKASFALALCQDWIESKDAIRRGCGYGLLYELSKNNRNKALTDELFMEAIDRIDQTIDHEKNSVRLSMGSALIGVGKRNKLLNKAAIKVVKRIGNIEYSDGDRKCDPLNIMKHLTSDYLKEKFAR